LSFQFWRRVLWLVACENIPWTFEPAQTPHNQHHMANITECTVSYRFILGRPEDGKEASAI
jgi:hypothetical protein